MATFTGRFLILAKLATEWGAIDPVLMNGELGVADAGSSSPVFKVGDGVRPWSALPQISGAGGGGANDYVVGTTTTLAPGSFASVTIDNSVDPPTISFGIPRGNTGPANTLAIGTVTTGAPESAASATITGIAPAQTLNLVIPQGPVGPQGEAGGDGASGPTGAPGPANELTIGTVTTGAPGSPADATITGTPPAQVLNLTIPRGADGAGLTLVDPTGEIGLTMVPGVATTTTRSDSSPPLSQAIVPTWTGAHVFAFPGSSATPNLLVSSPAPNVGWYEDDAAANNRRWDIRASAEQWLFRALSDDGSTASTILYVDRTGTAVDSLNFGNAINNPTYNFAGSGLLSVAGQIVVGAPTGGATGAGTINAQGLFVNGVAVGAIAAANPTALVGLTPVNGAAVTVMRSDAAPALDQSIAPLWTGVHNWGVGGTIQSDARLGARGRRNAFEFGHTNAAGYGNTIGYGSSSGNGFLAFHAEHGTNINTYRTRGVAGAVVQSDGTGGMYFGRLTNANADNQTLTIDVALSSAGIMSWANPLRIPSGLVGTPGLAFDGDADTGIYRGAPDNLRVAVGGGLAMQFTTSFNETFYPFYLPDGSASVPGLAFGSDPDLGIHRSGANSLGISAQGGVMVLQCGHANYDVVLPRSGQTSTGLSVGIGSVGVQLGTSGAAYGSVGCNVRFQTTSSVYHYAAADTASLLNFHNGGFDFYTAESGTAGSAISFSYVLRLTRAGLGSQALFTTGSPGAPAVSFQSDGNTGMYLIGADILGFSTGGTRRGYWYNGGFVPEVPVRFLDGSVGAPSITFDADTDTGWYRVSSDAIRLACGGVNTFGSTVTGCYIAIDGASGGAGTPYLFFHNDTDTGFYRPNSDQIGVTTGGTLRFTFTSSGHTSTVGITAPSFTTSSSRELKRETGRLRVAADILSRLRPVLYRMLAGDDREQVGLIAEEVHEICPQLSDGKTVMYDRLAVLLLADWQESRART